MTVTLRQDSKDITLPCGYQEWKRSRAPISAGKLARFSDEPVAGTFAWLGDSTCAIKLCAFETPYHLLYTLRFDGKQLTLDTETNVAFGAAKRPQLIGHEE